MSKKTIYLLIIVIVISSKLSFIPLAQGYGEHKYTDEEISAFDQDELNEVIQKIPSSHPRIYLKAAEIEALKARCGIGDPFDYDLNNLKWRGRNITFGEMAAEYMTIRNLAEAFKNDPEGLRKKIDPALNIQRIAETAIVYSFVNLLETDPAYVSSAKYILDKTLVWCV